MISAMFTLDKMYYAKASGTKVRAMVVAESGWPEAEAMGIAGSRSIKRADRVEPKPSERFRWRNGAGYGEDEQLLRLLPEVVRTAKAVFKKKKAFLVNSPNA